MVSLIFDLMREILNFLDYRAQKIAVNKKEIEFQSIQVEAHGSAMRGSV